jgi:glucose dehydrogenase
LGIPPIADASPTVVKGVVYAEAKYTYALSASTGATIWKHKTATNNAWSPGSPAVANAVVYVGSEDHRVYALKASSGAKLWSYRTGGQVESSPVVVKGVLYVGFDDGKLYALKARPEPRGNMARPASSQAGRFICLRPARP